MNRPPGSAARAALLALVLVGATADRGTAQLADTRAAAGVRLEAYSFGDPEKVDLERVVLVTVPLTVIVPLTRQLELGVNGAYARGEVRRGDGSEAALSGPIDTEVRLTAALAQDRLRLGIVALLPTGRSELTAEELDVAGVIAADLLPFAISNWGTGGGIGVNAAAAVPVGFNMAVGVSGGYVVTREFEPRSDASFAYRPGNQLHVRAALDRSFGSAGKASLQLIYQQFSQDRSGDANLYQAGDRLQAVASYAFAAGATASGVVYGGYLRRQQGRYAEVVLLTPAQDLIYGGAAVRVPLGGFVLLPTVDVRVLGNEAGLEQGYTLSAGAGAELPLGRLLLAPLARARFGSLTIREGLDSGFTGFELGFTARTRRGTP
jgi:hypothetical protein